MFSKHWLISLTVLAVTSVVSAELPTGHWPQWFGPDRTNVSGERGLLQEWPEGGPPLLWKAEGLGIGVACLSIAHGGIYTFGYRDDNEYVVALDEATGKRKWATQVGRAYPEFGSMRVFVQRTPTVEREHLYALSALGKLVCLRTTDGTLLWSKSYPDDFDGIRAHWGYCDYPLVDGDMLICTPGGSTSTVVALEKLTGQLIWKCSLPSVSKNHPTEGAHGAIVVAEARGIRQYVHQVGRGVAGISTKDGTVLWLYDKTWDYFGNFNTPIVKGNSIFCANGWSGSYALLDLVRDGTSIKVNERYFFGRVGRLLQRQFGNMVWIGDHIFVGREPNCIEASTGTAIFGWESDVAGDGLVTWTVADGLIYTRYSDGPMVLLEPSPEESIPKGVFRPPFKGHNTLTYPVVTGGRLYLRNDDILLCYDVRASQPASRNARPSRDVPAARQEETPRPTENRTRRPDAAFVPTPQDVVDKMLDLAAVSEDDLVYDLGCGDGRIVVTAAKRYGCKAVGYDIDPHCVRLSLENAERNHVKDLVTIRQEDIFEASLKEASVVTLYLGRELNAKLIRRFGELNSGSRIVSHEFGIVGYRPDKTIEYFSQEDRRNHTLHLWKTPLSLRNE